MATYVTCKNRQDRKVDLEVCLTTCKTQWECDNFNEVVNNAKKEQTPGPAKKEEVKPNPPQVQEEANDTDVRQEIISGPPMVPPAGKAQQLYQQVLSLKAEIEVRWFELGKILEEIFEGRHYIPLGYTSWRDFCETALGPLELKWRAIDYLRMTRKKCDEVGIGREIAGEIGWSRLKEIVPVVTRENKDRWIDVARKKETTVQLLNAKVRVARGKITEEESRVLPEKMFFSVFKEQKEIVELTLDQAGKVVGSDKKGSLLSDVICPSFLAEYPVGAEVGSRPEVIVRLLVRFQAAFKIKFTGEVIDLESGEVLVESEAGGPKE